MFIPTTNYWNVINGTTPDEVFEDEEGMQDRKSTRLNSSHPPESRMPSSA